MARLYAATGDAIARLDEVGEIWTVELSLSGNGAQCLAGDPAGPETVYAGLREGGVRRGADAGESWQPANEGRDRHYTWSVTVDPDDADCWYVSASTGPFAAHGRRDPQALIYRRRDGEPWQPLSGGLPEPLPAMPYALLATDGRLFAGLADGQLWESRDQGDNWTPLEPAGGDLNALVALAHTTD